MTFEKMSFDEKKYLDFAMSRFCNKFCYEHGIGANGSCRGCPLNFNVVVNGFNTYHLCDVKSNMPYVPDAVWGIIKNIVEKGEKI